MDSKDSVNNEEHSQFSLLMEKRFGPFFWTQFAGAFNDNIYKNVLILMIAFQAVQETKGQSDILINMAAGLFILPFFLFSAFAGQIADKYEKSTVIRVVKLCEILIMACAGVALYFNATAILLVLLFFMGTQSTFFGPVKYSIIPQHLSESEIIGGNALVEMGTFVSILLGTIAGGMLAQQDRIWAALVIVITAICGWWVSRGIPEAAPASPDLKISWNPVTQSIKTMGFAAKDRTVLLSIMGISWFWFLGASYLTQIPNYTKHVLYGSESVATLLLAMFSIGIGGGSLLCEWLSGKKVEYGLVPIGSLGLSIFGLDLALAYHASDTGVLLGILDFIKTPGSIRVLVDLILIGIFGGLYIVPLFALVQTRSEVEYRSRVIAANNIMNALFMVVAAVSGALLLGVAGLTIPQFFGVLVLMNLVVAVFIYSLVPEFTMRCLIWVLTHLFYRIKHENLDLIPTEGPAVIVCNHVSYVDALIIGSLVRRPARFVTAKEIFNIPVLNFIFRTGKAIPIVSRKKDPETYEKAFETISRELEDGQIVCIFPEGMLTKTGDINEFKNGIEKILERNPVPVVPTALRGLWGSFFSHKGGAALTRLPRRFFSKVEYKVGRVLSPEDATAPVLQEQVALLRGAWK
ncbi:MAG: MFS transporter [Proteobacteria bacterium]|nr:MFS transporter [Pseudomonadota bacterium]